MNMGYFQVYYGSGADHVPAALGLALRAAGAGLCVAFFSFERNDGLSSALGQIHFGTLDNDVDLSGFDVVILDGCDGLDPAVLAALVKNRPANVELVLAGTEFGQDILDAADLVSEIS